MRKPIVAGNWKMNKTLLEARQLVTELLLGLKAVNGVEKILCPPFTVLHPISELLQGTDIGLGAQNMCWEIAGAYTGEISPLMVAELCEYVILGHSERRQYFYESDEIVNKKCRSALNQGLIPIVCVGETLEEKEAGRTKDIVANQLRLGLAGLDQQSGTNLIIAYEPIWAIGTGRSATPEDANEIHTNVVRNILSDVFNQEIADSIRILYGGSVKANNADKFFVQSDIDGALVGGASLNATAFIAITGSAGRV